MVPLASRSLETGVEEDDAPPQRYPGPAMVPLVSRSPEEDNTQRQDDETRLHRHQLSTAREEVSLSWRTTVGSASDRDEVPTTPATPT